MIVDGDLKDSEERYRREILEVIQESYIELHKYIEDTKRLQKSMGLNGYIPNIEITMNNKLNELQREFEKSGLSLYGDSIVGSAIIRDLFLYTKKGEQVLNDYCLALNECADGLLKKMEALDKIGPIGRLFSMIKAILGIGKIEDSEYIIKQYEDKINLNLTNYNEIDKELYKYNIREQIIPSVKRLCEASEIKGILVPTFLYEKVIPDFEKLGLSDLIPKLGEAFSDEYQKAYEEQRKYIEEEMKFVDEIQSIFEENGDNGENTDNLEELKKKVADYKIMLSDFSDIYKTVTATDRQQLTMNIDEEVHPQTIEEKEYSEDEEKGKDN